MGLELSRKRVWITVILSILFLIIILYYSDVYIRRMRASPIHVFSLKGNGSFLKEDVALERSKETLVLEGYNLADWKVHPDGRTIAPDGSRDKYLSRNACNPKLGKFLFLNHKENKGRSVVVEQDDRQITCYVWIPK